MASDVSYGANGAFELGSPEPGWKLALIVSDGLGWEHVSVHAWRHRGPRSAVPFNLTAEPVQTRVPTWREMAYVKDLCWDGEDVVVQFHPRQSEYVNFHPHVLHLWRPVGIEIATPPPILVGPSVESEQR